MDGPVRIQVNPPVTFSCDKKSIKKFSSITFISDIVHCIEEESIGQFLLVSKLLYNSKYPSFRLKRFYSR